MRKLASIVEIASCDPIPDTERLSVATMTGKSWKVVTSRDEFKPGDLAVFFEIDSYLPADDERYSFLRERCLRKFVSKSGSVLREGIRIKTCKLRGVVSQGLLMPINKFVGENLEISVSYEKATPDNCISDDGQPLTNEDLEGIEVATLTFQDADGNTVEAVNGTDLTALLHVEHYDEVKEQMAPACGGGAISADALGKFPDNFARRSDEERLQNLSEYFTTMKGRKFEVTEKFDGTSTSIAYSPTIDPENPFMVCSRNLRLKEFTATGTMNLYWMMARKYDIERKLKEHYEKTGNEWMLQLETVGCGVNGNKDRYTDNQMFCFRIWDVKKQEFVKPDVRREFCKQNNIPHVRVIATDMPFFDVITTIEDALAFADGKTERGNPREGVVLKTSDDGEFRSFKIVSNKYLIKEND